MIRAKLARELRCLFFFNDTATTEIYPLSLHDALPISVLIAALERLFDDVLERLTAVAPRRVHLEIAAILRFGWTGQRRIVERGNDAGARQKILAPHAALLRLRDLAARLDCGSNRGRLAGLQHFEDHACRCRADMLNLLQRAIGLQVRVDRLFEIANGRRRALI